MPVNTAKVEELAGFRCGPSFRVLRRLGEEIAGKQALHILSGLGLRRTATGPQRDGYHCEDYRVPFHLRDLWFAR